MYYIYYICYNIYRIRIKCIYIYIYIHIPYYIIYIHIIPILYIYIYILYFSPKSTIFLKISGSIGTFCFVWSVAEALSGQLLATQRSWREKVWMTFLKPHVPVEQVRCALNRKGGLRGLIWFDTNMTWVHWHLIFDHV